MKTKHQKQQEAQERNAAWNELSYSDQIAALKNRPGQCKKQIAKIKEKMK